jgi:hypothetical protein
MMFGEDARILTTASTALVAVLEVKAPCWHSVVQELALDLTSPDLFARQLISLVVSR